MSAGAAREPATSVADLGEPWSRHPFLLEGAQRWSISRAWVSREGVLLDTLLGSGKRGMIGVGAAQALREPLAEALSAGPPPPLASLPRGSWQLVRPEVAGSAGLRRVLEWDWMVCDVPPPPQPGEERVRALSNAAERAEVAALLDVAYPSDMTASADRADRRLWGWRDDDGTLVGVAGALPLAPAGPVRLGGIATHPLARRRGIASALTAVVTRLALLDAPWVSLAIRADNHAARAVYLRLGFRVVVEMETLRPAPPVRADRAGARGTTGPGGADDIQGQRSAQTPHRT